MIELIIAIIIASLLIGIGVHFIPVGGAPAALSTSAGIPTGTPMITIGMGITGLLSASTMINQSQFDVLVYGALGSIIMIAITMFFSNIIHVYGVGVPLASASYKKDPITGFSQEEYVSHGTKGHGIPTISFISGIIGAFLGGLGGSIAFYQIYITLNKLAISSMVKGTLSAILSLMIFFIIAVISSYNIGGTMQGFYDKKFKTKILQGVISSFLVSILLSLSYSLIIWVIIYG